MEVIKHGNSESPEEWQSNLTCAKFDKYDREGCGAELQIEADDLVLRYFRGSHFIHYYTAIQCPECRKFTRVYELPERVLEYVQTPENKEAATFDGFEDR